MAIVPATNKRPGPGRPRRDETAAAWWPVFIAHYRLTGSALLAGEEAGVDPKTARHYRRSHAEAHRQARQARALFIASMQYELVKQARGESKGGFLPTVARIKAHSQRMHARYSEKVADANVMNLTINQLNTFAPPDAGETLQRMKASASLEEWTAMEGPAALNAAPPIEDAVIEAPTS